jgi:hypothetical protein
VQRAAILYLRALGAPPPADPDIPDDILQACADLCCILAAHARRPLLHHSLNCSCVGADEACFAHMVCAAGTGARDDALTFAMLLANPNAALLILPAAQRFGLKLQRSTASPCNRLPCEMLH